ncbi:MAG: hypothetical protein K1X72_08305 [Pyrinomonadaceae bacterium]|nr:hypothetical protein [Pyrinomonadaceae bacterium]
MKKLAILCVTFIFVALFSVAVSAQTEEKKDSPLLTHWSVTISAQGQDLPGTIKLEKDGDNFKGGLTTDLGEAPFKNIKINADNTFTAEVTANVQGQSFDGTVTGKLEGDKLSGEITLSGLGAFGYSGKKTEK